MTAATETPMLRWSSVRDCPRKAVYEATGAPARERTQREERILYRGKQIGRDYADAFAARNCLACASAVQRGERTHNHEGCTITRERKVRWAMGIGHIDFVVHETRSAIEVLSSAHASEDMIHSKLLQLVGYMDSADDIENGALAILNPSNYDEDRVIVSPASHGYAELVEEMRERVRQVQTWGNTADPPPRVCAKPDEALGHFCLHGAHCFEGWQPPPLEEIVADIDTVAAVAELSSVKAERARIAAEDKSLEKLQKELQARLDELPLGECQVGQFKIVRAHTQRKAKFDWERAELAGVFEPGLYGEFFKPGAAYDTWKIERAPMPVPVADEEETPF